MNEEFQRNYVLTLHKRLKEPRKFIQVLSGPRQAGKTTVALQTIEKTNIPAHYVSADEPALRGAAWIEQQWETARTLLSTSKKNKVLLVLDEIQKIPQWSETVKKLWDADTRKKIPLYVVLLGSSPLLLQQGLTESLAGRFEILYIPHWSFAEMNSAFHFTFNDYLFYGGYPGAASLRGDVSRWKQYINDSLIETTVSRDILLTTRVDKPALLRQLFHLACSYSCQIVSYQKLTGQLQDAGNTTTLAHYLKLLSGAGMVAGLEKYSPAQIRQRASSPKLLALNTALLSSQLQLQPEDILKERDVWGRLAETAVGAYLVNSAFGMPIKIFYWREGAFETDFVIQSGKKIIALEVKSGRAKENLAGIEQFRKYFSPYRVLLVGADGISIEQFISQPIEKWIE